MLVWSNVSSEGMTHLEEHLDALMGVDDLHLSVRAVKLDALEQAQASSGVLSAMFLVFGSFTIADWNLARHHYCDDAHRCSTEGVCDRSGTRYDSVRSSIRCDDRGFLDRFGWMCDWIASRRWFSMVYRCRILECVCERRR